MKFLTNAQFTLLNHLTILPPSVLANVKKVLARKSTNINIKETLILACAEGSLFRNKMSSTKDMEKEAALEMVKLAVICAWNGFLSLGLS